MQDTDNLFIHNGLYVCCVDTGISPIMLSHEPSVLQQIMQSKPRNKKGGWPVSCIPRYRIYRQVKISHVIIIQYRPGTGRIFIYHAKSSSNL